MAYANGTIDVAASGEPKFRRIAGQAGAPGGAAPEDAMRWWIVAATLAALAAPVPEAQAVGCLSGAVAGGIAGHYAGHHAVLGALGGCAVGHHLAIQKKKQKQLPPQGQPAAVPAAQPR